MNLVTDSIQTIHDLDLSGCIIGPDLIAHFGDGHVTLYRREGAAVELLGSFEEPSAALEVIDLLDAGTAARARYADPAGSAAESPFVRMSDGTVTITRSR
jgi:hypothetical protein